MHEELVEWATVAYRSNPNATNAVNAALNAGSKAENLLLSSPVLMDPTSGADADAPGPRDRAQRMVDELRSAHGSALACHARLFPSKLTTTVVQLQVDFDTASPRLGERFVRESFAGYATRCSPHSVAPACTTATRARRSVARQRTRPRVAQRNRCRMARRLERGRRPQHPLHRRLLHRRPLQSRRRSLRSRAFGVTIVRFAPHSFCC